jgi:hypothetical protein
LIENADFLTGSIDLHIHVGPDYMPRYGDSVRLATEARNQGMKAIVIKQHLASTVASAHLANQIIEGIRVFGGISLNEPSGGFNLRNVLAAVKSGAKMIWLPTVDAEYAIKKAESGHWIKHYVHGSSFGYQREGLNVLTSNKKLKDEVKEIVKICKESDVILGSGHLGPEECVVLAHESKKMGYGKLEITHPNAWLEDFDSGVLKELTKLGAWFTLSFGVCSTQTGRQDIREIANVIKEIGAEHCCLITDYGQVTNPSPVEGYRVFCQLLSTIGVSNEELDLMTKVNPSRLLSI